jgi:formate hydrogenlyase subunit 3/multisubunit Na+/H+ antiporter MnhD subunit
MALDLVVAAILLAIAGSALAWLAPRTSLAGQRLATAITVLSMLSGLSGAGLGLAQEVAALAGRSVDALTGMGAAARGVLAHFPWQAVGDSLIGLDALSAFFLVPIFLIGGLGSIYGLGYRPRKKYPGSSRRIETFWGLLIAGMALLVIARHALAFLLGWEAMALSAFFLMGAEDSRAETRRAGLVYLIATHVGTLTLFAVFALWRRVTGSFALFPVQAGSLGAGTMTAIFLLALLGFGLKAGLMPLHFWLPGAHANAASQVSAILSGVVLKMGVYGLLRILLLLEDPPAAWGGLLLILGSVSAILGVAFAIGQHDLKRLLAYHSVENIGIIFMGLGVAMLGRSSGNAALLVLGLSGCLLHVWNHALFKPLLFLGAGAVLHGAHTREIDRLGGLAKRMPYTAAGFLVGAVAISGLPPLNGFVSELLVYLGLFGGLAMHGTGYVLSAMAAPVLATTGALALACFVKVYGTAFLGLPRSGAAERAHEATPSMIIPMAVLALACAFIGLAPGLVAPILDAVVAPWAGPVSGAATAAAGAGSAAGAALPRLAGLAPLGAVGSVSLALAIAIALLVLASRLLARPRAVPGTWDCGYAAPTARMQYSASSFARSIVGLFSWALHPRERKPCIEGDFPGPSEMGSQVDDPVLDRRIVPAFRGFEKASLWFHRFQQGLTQSYILAILVATLILLSTLVPFEDILAQLLRR